MRALSVFTSFPLLRLPVLARYITLLFVAFSLPACDYFNPPPPAPKHKPAKRAKAAKKAEVVAPTPEAYVRSLTLARIALVNEDMNLLNAQMDVLSAAPDAKKRKSATQMLVVLTYESKGSSLKKVVAPVPDSPKESQYRALAAIMAAKGKAATLHDVSLSRAPVTPEPLPEATEGSDVSLLAELLARRQNELLAKAEKLPALESVRKQMSLVRFFIASRARDAAYITMDNLKKQIAGVADSEESKALSLEVDGLEQQLHKAMPYTLP